MSTPASCKMLRLVIRYTHQHPDWFESQWRTTLGAMPYNLGRLVADSMLADGVIDQGEHATAGEVAGTHFDRQRGPE